MNLIRLIFTIVRMWCIGILLLLTCREPFWENWWRPLFAALLLLGTHVGITVITPEGERVDLD